MKNRCQAYTKKKTPCKNYAMQGSDFCRVHEGLFKGLPPVKITALICPYCDEPLEGHAKFCSLCKHDLLVCPYCDKPLRKDAKSCKFCNEDLTPAIPMPDKSNYYEKLIDIGNWIAAKCKDISHGFFWVIVFLLISGFVSFIFILLYLDVTQ